MICLPPWTHHRAGGTCIVEEGLSTMVKKWMLAPSNAATKRYRRRSTNHEWISVIILFILLHSGSCSSVCQQHKTVFTAFEGNITDGPNPYKSDQRCEWLILSPDGDRYPFITLRFTTKWTECTYDYIMVHDGDSYESPLLATFSGEYPPSHSHQVVAKSGKMLVYFFSDINTTSEGFEATYSISECPNNCSGNGDCRENRCHCEEAWTGPDCSQDACPFHCTSPLHGYCRTESKKCHCERGFIGFQCGMSTQHVPEEVSRWTTVYDDMDMAYGGVEKQGGGGRAGHTGVYAAPYFYIFGGYNLNEPLGELLRYNFQTNEWLLMQLSNQPSPRFFHTLSDVGENPDSGGHSLLLYGGDLGDDSLSDETWIYDTGDLTWKRHAPQSWHSAPPHLCQHAAAVAVLDSEKYVYIHGGRIMSSPDEGLSSGMYRFGWANQHWEKVTFDPSGVKASDLRMAGHSMVYDKVDRSLVMFGGFRMMMMKRQIAHYSNTVFIYSLEKKRWAEIHHSSPGISSMAFHTANVIGDYMVVHGGTVNGTCFRQETHFYDLRCHKWVQEPQNPSPSVPTGRYSHTSAVIDDIILLIHGGYDGTVSNHLMAYKLAPLDTLLTENSQRSICSGHLYKIRCESDFVHGCVWNGECTSEETPKEECGSICPNLTDCVSCTTFKSYTQDSSHEWHSEHCAWCVQEAKCFAVNGNSGVCEGRREEWWSDDGATILREPESCLLEDIPPGVVAAQYNPNPNFSHPDKVLRLSKVSQNFAKSGDFVFDIQGFLHVRMFDADGVVLKLLSTNGMAEFNLSSSHHPSDAVSIITTEQKNSMVENITDAIELKELGDDRYYIRIRFKHTGESMWEGMIAAERSMGQSERTYFKDLASDVLEPYQSALFKDVGKLPSCEALSNCLACLTDMSCAWCESRSVCVRRSLLAERPLWCSLTDHVATHVGMIMEPASCTVCPDYLTCHHCLAAPHCEWQVNKCGRPDDGASKITDYASCPVPCHLRSDCMTCLDSVDTMTGVKQDCAWCSTTQKCYRFGSYHLMAYPFGQCGFWVDKQAQCQRCSEQRTCGDCLDVYECGWCSTVSNPLRGYCTKGGFAGPETPCNGSLFQQSPDEAETKWSYASCPDVNECTLEWPAGKKLHKCHEDATCINTIGSYQCECEKGYKGNGYDCEKTCYMECKHGHCSEAPDYRCVCDLGWTSINRSEDTGVFSGDGESFTECDIDCGCNLLSTCLSGPGTCDDCHHNSTGPTCERCLPGFFHSHKPGHGCLTCHCNGHGRTEDGLCDEETGACFCQHNTHGFSCEECEDGYYGDPRNGGTCYHKCRGKTRVNVSEGALGSWQVAKRELGSLIRHGRKDVTVTDCEWELMPVAGSDAIVSVTIEKEINVPCFTNKVLVYDGIPGDEGSEVVGTFCGSNWKNDITVQVNSGVATIRYADVLPANQSIWTGFNATFSTSSPCIETLTTKIYNEEDTLSPSLEHSGEDEFSMFNISENHSAVVKPSCNMERSDVESVCPGNCYFEQGQGYCKNDLCHCYEGYTGQDCSVLSGDVHLPVTLRLHWGRGLSTDGDDIEDEIPGRLLGGVLAGSGQDLWLHGGVSPETGPSADLWRYNLQERVWTLVKEELSAQPSERYFHASAPHPGNKGFFIHGGLLRDGHTNSELWHCDEDGKWQELKITKLPALAGHTMTFCDSVNAYIIGGYNSNSGYNHNVWKIDIEDSSSTLIHSKQIHPPYTYGHGAVCDGDTGLIYVFGGVETYILQTPSPSDSLLVFNTTDHKWQSVFLRGAQMPRARAFHANIPYSLGSAKGMLVVGGQLESGDTSNEIWLFLFQCKKWIRLHRATGGVELSALASVAAVGQDLYMYGGTQHGMFVTELIRISDIRPCRAASNEEDCSSMPFGCKICANGTEFVCLSADDVFPTLSCVEDPAPPTLGVCKQDLQFNCSFLRDCRSCLSARPPDNTNTHKACHWCRPLHADHGLCRPVDMHCGPRDDTVSNKRECDHCASASCSACDVRHSCSWNETEVMSPYDKILKTFSCHALKTPLVEGPTSQPAVPIVHDGHVCPGACSTYPSCETCLGYRDWKDKWKYCVWAPGLARCIDPAFTPLLCHPGGQCGTLASKGPASCPVEKCAHVRFCWKCINQPDCGWLQNGTTGHCLEGSSKNPSEFQMPDTANTTAKWWYHECPLENECLAGLDDCLGDPENRERCVDLEQGFKCVCQDGYARNSSSERCVPVCTAGCDQGNCVHPDLCDCDFGYTGISCNIACRCNGHSDCEDADHPDRCLQCKHNTVGAQCESCAESFVGDPKKNETCIPCKEVCMERAEKCTSKDGHQADRGPTFDDVKCIGCGGNSQGDRCDECRDGYFMLDRECHLCRCNGHSRTCNPKTGGLCKCQNHTKSSDPKCDSNSHDSYPGGCWNTQCDKCEDSYQGDPRDGGQCYRQVIMEQKICFNPESPAPCLPSLYDSIGNHVDPARETNNALPAGQTILFALNPKYTNVNIRITVDVTFGELSVYLSDRLDAFIVETDPSTFQHEVIPNPAVVDDMGETPRQRRDLKLRSGRQGVSEGEGVAKMRHMFHEILQDEDHVSMDNRSPPPPRRERRQPHTQIESEGLVSQRSSDGKPKIRTINATDFNFYTDLPPGTALVVHRVRSRLVISIPHEGYELRTTKFYVILLGHATERPPERGRPDSLRADNRSKRAVGPGREENDDVKVADETAGRLLFRQDQTHIDLFVFFSVFFSCFFLFLAICIVTWKVKQFVEAWQVGVIDRNNQRHMASRPFGCVYVMLSDYSPEPILECRRGKESHGPTAITRNRPSNMDQTSRLFQARSCPVFAGGNQDAPGPSGYLAAPASPYTSSLPTSPGLKQTQKRFGAKKILARRGVDCMSLDLSPRSADLKLEGCGVAVGSLNKGTSESSDFIESSSDQLLVLHASDYSVADHVPVFNSTAVLRKGSSGDGAVRLTPVSSSSSRTPSPMKSTTYIDPGLGVDTVASLAKDGHVSTRSKRKTLPPLTGSMSFSSGTTAGVARSRFRSTPNLPTGQIGTSAERRSLSKQEMHPRPEQAVTPPGTVVRKLSRPRFGSRSRNKDRSKGESKPYAETPGPVAWEPTENGVASVNTVFLQLPGGAQAPVLACLGTSLVTTRNVCYPSFVDVTRVPKSRFKFRTSKML